jgi:hypothetical protein
MVHILQDGVPVVAITDMNLERGASDSDGINGSAVSDYDLFRSR